MQAVERYQWEGHAQGITPYFTVIPILVTTRNLGLLVFILLIYLLLRLVVSLKSCCNILSCQLKPHNPSWLTPSFHVLLGLGWYLFCRHHPCLLGLVTRVSSSVWTSFWVLTPSLSQSPANSCCFPLHHMPCCLYASVSPLYSPGHTGWVGTAFAVPSTVRCLSTTGRCCCRHTSPSHGSLPAYASGLLPIASSLKDILALVTIGEQLQQNVKKISLADGQE